MKRPFKKLLVPVSFRERTRAIYSYARRFAEVNEGTVTLFHSVPTQSYRLMSKIYRPEESGGANQDHAEQVAREGLERIAREELAGVRSEILVRVSANPARAVLEIRDEGAFDLVVVGKSQASELTARFQGGLIEKLIRSGACPVLCASALERFAEQESVRDVLAPVALDRASVTVARLARSFAETQGGKVTLLHVLGTDPATLKMRRDLYGFDPDEPVSLSKAQKTAEERLRAIAAAEIGGVSHEVAVVIAYDVAEAIRAEELARDPGIIIMATAGYTGFFQIVLGSAAESVARGAGCSVMTIRVS